MTESEPQTASFNNGLTTQRHVVSVHIDDDHLVITSTDGALLVKWPLDEIRYASPPGIDKPVRLKWGETDARLNFETIEEGAWLTARCPNLKRRNPGRVRWPVWVGAGVFALLSVIGIITILLPGIASSVTELVPIKLEENIGQQSEEQLLQLFSRVNDGKTGTLCRHPAGERILNKRAEEIALILDSPFRIHVSVVRMPIANALTLPGGRVIILSGLIEKAKNGDEVIGVLAHEIAHAVRRDPLRVSIKQTGTAVLVSLLIGDIFGGALMSGLVSGIIESGYSRDAETASDFLAVTALNQLGLTARPLAEFVGRLSQEDPATSLIPEFLQTHPAGANREKEIMALSQGHGRALTRYEWQTLQTICDN